VTPREQLLDGLAGALRTRPFFLQVAEGYPVPPPAATACPAAFVYLRPWTQSPSTNLEQDNEFMLHVALLVNGPDVERRKLHATEEAEQALWAWFNAASFAFDAQLLVDAVDPSLLALNSFGHPDLPTLLPPFGAVRMDLRLILHYQT
jgi:hypothetical protein